MRPRLLPGIAALLVGVSTLVASAHMTVAQTKKPPAKSVVADNTFKSANANLLTNPSHEGPGVFYGGRGEVFVS